MTPDLIRTVRIILQHAPVGTIVFNYVSRGGGVQSHAEGSGQDCRYTS